MAAKQFGRQKDAREKHLAIKKYIHEVVMSKDNDYGAEIDDSQLRKHS